MAEEILNNHCDCELLPECMAEEYLKKHNYTSGYIGYFASGYCKQAFLAGLRAGRGIHVLTK